MGLKHFCGVFYVLLGMNYVTEAAGAVHVNVFAYESILTRTIGCEEEMTQTLHIWAHGEPLQLPAVQYKHT